MTSPHRRRSAAPHLNDSRTEDWRARRRELERITVDYANATDRCQDVIASLMSEYEQHVSVEHAICRGCPVDRSSLFIVYSMLEWKAIYGDGRLGHWTRDDIREYLLDHFPHKISADRQLLLDTPTCVRDLVYFMSDRGTLAGDEVRVLADAGDELFDEFLAANRDRRKWGLAKRMVMGAAATVDEADDRYVPPGHIPARGRRGNSPTHRTGSGTPAQRAKRKAARTARQRNRR